MHHPNASYLESTRQRLLGRTRKTRTCWLWEGARNSSGYGKLYFDGRVVDAHRVSWTVHMGPIPDGAVIAHHCDVKLCIRPDHLFETTQKGNLDDMRAKARESRGPQHSAAIQAGWTPSLRAKRAEQTRGRMRERHAAAALEAGVPRTWKHCPDCATWKPRRAFQRNSARHDGLKSICAPCSTIQRRKLRKRERA